MLLAVTYHYVRPEYDFPHLGITGPTVREFQRQLELLAKMGTFVSLSDVERVAMGMGRLPRPAILITFDDGLREHAEHALPILDQMGIPAAFFVNTAGQEGHVMPVHRLHHLLSHHAIEVLLPLAEEAFRDLMGDFPEPASEPALNAAYRYGDLPRKRFKYLLNYQTPPERYAPLVERLAARCSPDAALDAESLYMSIEQVSAMAVRGYIGSHGHDHENLGRLSPEQAAEDIKRARDRLAAWCGSAPASFSYPYGTRESCPATIAAIARASGHVCAFTVERGLNADFSSPMYLGRFDTNDVPGGKSCHLSPEEFLESQPSCTWGRAVVAD